MTTPSIFINIGNETLDPTYDVRKRGEIARLLNQPAAYDRIAIDISRVDRGSYQIDWLERVDDYTKMSVVFANIQWRQQGKLTTLYGGGINNANAAQWISRFSQGQGPSEIRRLFGPGLCYCLDAGEMAYCGDMFGYVDAPEEPPATQIARALAIHAMRQMGWIVKVEAFMNAGHYASDFPSMSTAYYFKDARFPATYLPKDHEIIMSNSDGTDKVPGWLAAGHTIYIGSTFVGEGKELPAWWPASDPQQQAA